MKPFRTLIPFLLLSLPLVGCNGGGAAKGGDATPFPPTEAGARALLTQFLAPGADRVKLTLALRPTAADYRKVFSDEAMAAKAEKAHAPLWEAVKSQPLGPGEGQTELLLWSATTVQLKDGTGAAKDFPGGYKRVVAHLKPGLTVYRWKFVKPGQKLGMAYDGLYHLDGRWILIPKPWRFVR